MVLRTRTTCFAYCSSSSENYYRLLTLFEEYIGFQQTHTFYTFATFATYVNASRTRSEPLAGYI